MDENPSPKSGPSDRISALTVHGDKSVTPAPAGKVTPASAGIVNPESSGNESLSSPAIDGREQMDTDKRTRIKRGAVNAVASTSEAADSKKHRKHGDLPDGLLSSNGDETTLPEPKDESDEKRLKPETSPPLASLEEGKVLGTQPSPPTSDTDERWWASLLSSSFKEHFLSSANGDRQRTYAEVAKQFPPMPIPPLLPTDGSCSLVYLAYRVELDKWKTKIQRSLEDRARHDLHIANYLHERINKQTAEVAQKRALTKKLARELEHLRALELKQVRLCKASFSTSEKKLQNPDTERHPSSSSLADGPPIDPQSDDQETVTLSVGTHL